MSIIQKYAHLLVHYCLEIKKGESLYLSSTTLAEPLVREVYSAAIQAGAHVEVNLSFCEESKIFLKHAQEHQIRHISPLDSYVMEHFDAYLLIRAPFNLREGSSDDLIKSSERSKALAPINQLYFNRTASGEMKRGLCQYPTQASAQEAGMSLSEYEDFVYTSCKLYEEDPQKAWLKVREEQQRIVDYLNNVDSITYSNPKTNITFSVKGRTWINSDGKANMPSGEVFTGAIENSINGIVFFDYPSIYKGQEVKNITLEVKDGVVTKGHAEIGNELLQSILKIDGANRFGEVAIGTNYSIKRATKNILFDEKIGGTIHMAIGQSYKQTGGTNISPIHWDMIANMTEDAHIMADDKIIYKNGNFLI